MKLINYLPPRFFFFNILGKKRGGVNQLCFYKKIIQRNLIYSLRVGKSARKLQCNLGQLLHLWPNEISYIQYWAGNQETHIWISFTINWLWVPSGDTTHLGLWVLLFMKRPDAAECPHIKPQDYDTSRHLNPHTGEPRQAKRCHTLQYRRILQIWQI